VVSLTSARGAVKLRCATLRGWPASGGKGAAAGI